MVRIRKDLNFTAKTLNLGGGYGVWYTDEDKKITPAGYAEYLKAIVAELKEKCAKKGLDFETEEAKYQEKRALAKMKEAEKKQKADAEKEKKRRRAEAKKGAGKIKSSMRRKN